MLNEEITLVFTFRAWTRRHNHHRKKAKKHASSIKANIATQFSLAKTRNNQILVYIILTYIIQSRDASRDAVAALNNQAGTRTRAQPADESVKARAAVKRCTYIYIYSQGRVYGSQRLYRRRHVPLVVVVIIIIAPRARLIYLWYCSIPGRRE